MQRLTWQLLPGAAGLPHALSRQHSDGDAASQLPPAPVLSRLDTDVVRVHAGDRVTLPSAMLESSLEASRGNYPMTFELRSYNGTRVYVGVQEFTSPADVISLPRSVVEALNLDLQHALADDKRISVRYVELPKATAIKLAPFTSDFTDIADPRAFLENALRSSFTVLMPGQILTLRHEGFNYQLAVVEVTPAEAPAVTIVNTDCVVDIAPALDGGVAKRRATASLKLGEAVNGTASAKEPAFYSLSVPRDVDLNVYAVYVEVTRPAGVLSPTVDTHADADVYISRGDCKKPDLVHHVWSITNPGGGRVLLLPSTQDVPETDAEAAEAAAPSAPALDASVTVAALQEQQAEAERRDARRRQYHVGVHGFGGKAAFVLKADIVEKRLVPKDVPSATVLRIGAPAADASRVTAVPDASVAVAPGMKLCPSCGSAVPEANFAMHAAMCARNTVKCPHPGCGAQLRRHANTFVEHWHCPTCHLVMHESLAAKHAALLHTPLACACGSSFLYSELLTHVRSECPARMTVCRFCGATNRAGPPPSDAVDRLFGYTEHEAYCGSRSGVCGVEGCGARIRLKDAFEHCATAHPGMPPVPAEIPVDLPPATHSTPSHDEESLPDEAPSMPYRGELGSSSVSGSSVAGEPWACPACTYENAGFAAFCHMCTTARPAAASTDSAGTARPVRAPAAVTLCANQTCSNPAARRGDAEVLGLCQRCFRLFAAEHDDTEAMRGALISRYNTQMEVGCGEPDCRNPYCASGRANAAPAAPTAPPTLQRVMSFSGELVELMTAMSGDDGQEPRYYVCVTSCQRPLIRRIAPAAAPAPEPAAAVAPAAAPASGGLFGMLGSVATTLGIGATHPPAAAPAPAARPAAAPAAAASVAEDRRRAGRVASAFFK